MAGSPQRPDWGSHLSSTLPSLPLAGTSHRYPASYVVSDAMISAVLEQSPVVRGGHCRAQKNWYVTTLTGGTATGNRTVGERMGICDWILPGSELRDGGEIGGRPTPLGIDC